MEGRKGSGPDASRKDSGDCSPVGEAIPVRIEDGPAGNDVPPRSGPLTPTPSSRRGLRTVGDVRRAGLNEECLATAATRDI